MKTQPVERASEATMESKIKSQFRRFFLFLRGFEKVGWRQRIVWSHGRPPRPRPTRLMNFSDALLKF